MSPFGRRPTREQLEPWLPAPPALPWWVPSAYIAAIILVGFVLIAIGVARPGGGEQGTDRVAPSTAPEGLQASPPPATQGGTVGPGESKDEAPRPKLDRVRVLDRFTIGVPRGWSRGVLGGAVVLDSSRGAWIRVFLEGGRAHPRRLATQAARFLAATHPSARIDRPERRRLAGRLAFALTATWRRGRERAVVVSASGYSYLLLARVERGASPKLETEAEAALESFRPR